MEIDQIKTQLTLADVLKYYHLKPDKNLRLNCPFHDDKTPSLQVYYKTHSCYCFSSNCKTHGKSLDVIDFIMHKENITKHEAIMKAKAMINGEAIRKPIDELTRSAVLTKIFIYFKNGLHSSSPAKEYLEKRNLNHDKTEIGYNSGQFHHGKRKEEALIKSCVKYGLLLETGGKSRTGKPAYKPFGKYCIAFALRNPTGQITGLYFRSTLDDNKQRHYYLKDRQGLYPKYPRKETKKLILTESIIDAASLLEQLEIQKNYEVLAMYGTNGLTEEHVEAIHSLADLEEVIFFLNGDAPGRKAVEKYAPVLKHRNPKLKISNVEVPEGEDVNSLLQAHSSGILSHLIMERREYQLYFSSEDQLKEKPGSTVRVLLGVEPGELEMAEASKVEEKVSNSRGLDCSNPFSIKYRSEEAHYEIKGFRLDQLDSLKATLAVQNAKGEHTMRTTSPKIKHYGKVDLYDYKQVKSYVATATQRTEISSTTIETDLMDLTELLEKYRSEKQKNKGQDQKKTIKVDAATASKCLAFLKQEHLLTHINNLIEKCGITGEKVNRLLLFVVASSYKMPDTLHALIQGSSGSGKTRLLKVISDTMPPEDVKKYTRVTDNSFYNQDEYFFVNKLVCFEDMDGLKEEAQLAVRELQSNEILISSTSVKDKNGSIYGGERVVRGPIASLSCTTKGETYEDNISRCFLIAVDESKEQTLRVIDYQNRKAAGNISREEERKARHFLQNCMRLLKSYEVVNPYANKIKLPEEAHKIRRLNELYQSFVRQVTLLNQYRRKKDARGRLITDKEDLQTACDILFESIILKVDELDGSLRQFFEKLKDYVRSKADKERLKSSEADFNRFEVRKVTGVSKTQQHYYMSRLVEMEYLRQYGYANRGYKYKIAHWDNMAATRAMIKDRLESQLQQI